MTEEEKKVIEYFKKSFTSKTPPYWYDDTIENSEIKIKTLVNLIEKLQKENEELKEKNDNNNVYKDLQEDLTSLLKKEFIPKDKIRKKLKAREEDREDCDNSIIANNLLRDIYLLRELLEEE